MFLPLLRGFDDTMTQLEEDQIDTNFKNLINGSTQDIAK